MVRVDLITGFLGAGKTTFIHHYLHYLKERGERVLVIENEFGPVSVDSTLLKNEVDDDCHLSDLTGMCMCCTGRAALETLLSEASGKGFTHIVIEPSGIYDVDEFFSVMAAPQVVRDCEIGTIVSIADARWCPPTSREAGYLTACQLAASGTVLLSRTQLTDPALIPETRQLLDELMREYGCAEGLSVPVWDKSWDAFTTEDLSAISASGYRSIAHDRTLFDHQGTFDSVLVSGKCVDVGILEEKIAELFSGRYGAVLRIKGTVKCVNGDMLEVNCTSETTSIVPGIGKKGLLVVIGQGLNEDEIREAFRI